MSILSTDNKKSHVNRSCFFDESVDIARYDKVKYPQIEKLTDKHWSFFWRPNEVELTRDNKDFKALTEFEQHIFTSNLKRQIVLDSVQGRAPSLAFSPICSLPEIETWIQTWAFFETIHSKSYTHIIRNVYPDPSVVFDTILDIPEIVECAADISKYYDQLIEYNNSAGTCGTSFGDYQHKKLLWLCLNAVNALEGVRFYVSFACSWAFAELKKMEGNAKIIKFIARDENLHLAFTQQAIKILPKEDPDFAKIAEETKPECISIFEDVIRQEKEWAKFVFKHGSMIGLNETLACDYIDWIGIKRMNAIGLSTQRPGANPLPWTQRWISGGEVQVAPQETEISSYLVGAVKQDVTEETFKGFEL